MLIGYTFIRMKGSKRLLHGLRHLSETSIVDLNNILIYQIRLLLTHRYTARSSCKVDLRDYPLDDQICHLAFESCK